MKAVVVALCDLFQIGSSKRVLKSQWKTGGVPFYRGREVTRLAADGFVDNELFISENHYAELASQYGVPKAGDIVITAIGTIGNSYIVQNKDKFYFKDASVLWMKKSSDTNSQFINYWLKSPQFFDQLDRGNGATVDTLTIQKLQSLQISIPPASEQHRIVAILDKAFDGIATAKANAEKNLQNARAIFESYLNDVFDRQVEENQCFPLESLTDPNSPITYGVVKPGDEGTVAFVRGGDLVRGEVRLSQLRTITQEVSTQYKRTLLKGGELLVCLVGQPGQVGVAQPELAGANIARQVGLIRLKNGIDAEYVKYYFQSPKGQDALLAKQSGSVQQVINLSELRQIMIPSPAQRNQEIIVKQINYFRMESERIESIYQQKLTALDDLKKSLLHQAFTSKL